MSHEISGLVCVNGVYYQPYPGDKHVSIETDTDSAEILMFDERVRFYSAYFHADPGDALVCNNLHAPVFSQLRFVQITATVYSMHIDLSCLSMLKHLVITGNDTLELSYRLPTSLKALETTQKIPSVSLAEALPRLTNLRRLDISEEQLPTCALPPTITTLCVYCSGSGAETVPYIKRLPALQKLSLVNFFRQMTVSIDDFKDDSGRVCIEQITFMCDNTTCRYESGRITHASSTDNTIHNRPDLCSLRELYVTRETVSIPNTVRAIAVHNEVSPDLEPAKGIERYTSMYDGGAYDNAFILASCATLTVLSLMSRPSSILQCSLLRSLELCTRTLGDTLRVQPLSVLKCLELLAIERYTIEDSETISELSSALRYMNVKNSHLVNGIPRDIARLTSLCGLEVHPSVQLPESIGRMQSLTYIDTNTHAAFGGKRPAPLPYSLCRLIGRTRVIKKPPPRNIILARGVYYEERPRLTFICAADRIPPAHYHLLPLLAATNVGVPDLAQIGYTVDDVMRNLRQGPCSYNCYCPDHFAERYATPDSYLGAAANKDILWSICMFLINEQRLVATQEDPDAEDAYKRD